MDNLGETTYYRYDSRGNLVAMADADGPAGPTISRRAFSNGALTDNTTNLYGNVTLYFYDGLDRKVMEEQILTPNGQGDGVHIGASIYGVKDTPSAPESYPPTPDPSQGGGDGIIRTGWNYDKDSLLSSMIDDDGNVTLYLYDDLNRQVLESEGLVVGSTYTESNILGSRVIPTPTAATIDDPATIPDSLINAQLTEAQSLIAAVASLFPPLAGQINDSPPTTQVWGYSPNDNVLIYQDENGSETFTKYDAINRPIAVRIFRAGAERLVRRRPDLRPGPDIDPVRAGQHDGGAGDDDPELPVRRPVADDLCLRQQRPDDRQRRLDGHRRLRQPGPDHRGDADDRQPADPGDRLGLARRRPAQVA